MENYEHYITKNIKDVCRTKMISPIIYLILLLALWILSPISEIVVPEKADSNDSLTKLYKQDVSYIDTKLTDLYFTGYTQTSLGFTTGYYYYTMRGNECILVLLSPSTSEEGLPKITALHTKGRLAKRDRAAKDVLDNLSKDLNWTETGIASKVSPYYINEPDCRNFRSYLLLFLYFASMLYAFISLILLVIYYRFPLLSPPVRQLSRFWQTCGSFLPKQKKSLLHCHSLPRMICLSQSIILLKLLNTELRSYRSGKLSGFTNILPCTNFSGIISAFPIRCTLRQTSIYISTVRKISSPTLTVSWTI